MDTTQTKLVPLLYDAATEPEMWPVFLCALARRLGAIAPGIMLADRDSQLAVLDPSFGPDPELGRRYHEYYRKCDVRRVELQKRPVGTVVAGHELVRDEVMVQTEFCNDFLRPLGIFHVAVAIPFKDDRRIGMLCLSRPPAARRFEDEELAVLRGLQGNLRRALELHLELAQARDGLALGGAALARLATAAIAINGCGRAAPANAAAERLLAARDGLAVESGELHANDPAEDASLQRLLAAALRALEGAATAGGCTSVTRPSGRRPLGLRVVPLPAAGGRLGVPSAAALVFVGESERVPHLEPEALRGLYGLTPAEARIAARLGAGRALAKIARELGVSLETVRTHRTHLFRKTGVRSQSELVVLLLSGPAAIPFDEGS
jgi:DNA-binding CsgD family transcriptional regulator/GAF domain-containing protein